MKKTNAPPSASWWRRANEATLRNPSRPIAAATAVVIVNPIAGPGRAPQCLPGLLHHLRQQGFAVELCTTTRPREAETRARQAAQDQVDRVIVAAGDGTLNEVIHGLLSVECEPRPAVGLLPIGTGNVAAINFGLPRSLTRACRVAAGNATRAVDVGVSNGRHFLSMTGVGFDARVIQRVTPGAKRRLRDLAYFLQALVRFPRWPATRMELTLDDQPPFTREAWLALINNGARYAWSIRLSPEARMDDGRLDLFLCTGRSKSTQLSQIVGTVLGRPALATGVEHWPARSLVVETATPWPVHLDGEVIGVTPVRSHVVPRALRILVPVATDL